jgi:hypothetical protein
MNLDFKAFLKDAGWEENDCGWRRPGDRGLYFGLMAAVYFQAHEDAQTRARMELIIENRKWVKEHTGK